MKATVIGLGAMGAGMAGNLFRAGHLKLAWNRSAERAQAAAAAHGFAIADSLEAAAGQADLVITSVSADGDLREVVGGGRGPQALVHAHEQRHVEPPELGKRIILMHVIQFIVIAIQVMTV